LTNEMHFNLRVKVWKRKRRFPPLKFYIQYQAIVVYQHLICSPC